MKKRNPKGKPFKFSKLLWGKKGTQKVTKIGELRMLALWPLLGDILLHPVCCVAEFVVWVIFQRSDGHWAPFCVLLANTLRERREEKKKNSQVIPSFLWF